MIRNYFLLNLLLIIIIGLLGSKLYEVYKYSVEIPSQASVSEDQEAAAVESEDKVLDETAFEAISELDLFRPSRSIPLIQNKEEEKPPLPPPPKLFGTVILNEKKTAILEDPESKTTKVYRINDTIAGYTVLEIHEDKVVLSGNDQKVDVRLRDDKGVQQPTRRTPTVRPAPTTPPAGQIGSPGAPPQRRARPVPPRRRPTGTTAPVTPQAPQAPQAPEASQTPEAPDTPDMLEGEHEPVPDAEAQFAEALRRLNP